MALKGETAWLLSLRKAKSNDQALQGSREDRQTKRKDDESKSIRENPHLPSEKKRTSPRLMHWEKGGE